MQKYTYHFHIRAWVTKKSQTFFSEAENAKVEAQKMINADRMKPERNVEREVQDMLDDNQIDNRTEEYESEIQQMITTQEKLQEEKSDVKTA